MRLNQNMRIRAALEKELSRFNPVAEVIDDIASAMPSARAVMLRTEPQASPPSGFPSLSQGEIA